MEKIRKAATVFTRENSASDWQGQDFDSISAAKKFNGPNSRTVQSAKNLPPKVEPKTEAAA